MIAPRKAPGVFTYPYANVANAYAAPMPINVGTEMMTSEAGVRW